jgi:type IV pilus assembly protein PilZ
MKSVGTEARQGILSLTIKDKNALYAAFMDYVEGGGLFIPTHKKHNLGDEVFMLLSLMGEVERIPVAGTIIWITPVGAEGSRSNGVGVQFNDQDGGAARAKIETYLAGTSQTGRPTHTM